MPKIGLTMTEGTIVEWKKQAGETVEQGEILFVFETEKVTYEVEAPASGILHRILYPEGSTAPVSEVVAIIAQPGEEVGEVEGAAPPEAATVEAGASLSRAPEAPPAAPASQGGRLRASPVARKLARLHHVDLNLIHGSGSKGRILKADVDAFMVRPPASPVAAIAPQTEQVRRISGMRRIIAAKMLASKVEAAQAYMDNDVDASQVVAVRKALLPEIEQESGVKVTVTDLMMFITAAAIKRHPVMNTRWSEEGIVYYPYIHMGMAMMLDEGLIVPVIWDIDRKTIPEIALTRKDLVDRGRQGKLTPDEMKGSTFTLSAMGMLGIQRFTAIINQPESAILAVGAITDMPVARNGEVTIRPLMNVTLTYDHRIIDGAEAAKFMATLKKFIEHPFLVFTSKTS
jgi:pyruvate dehydrogenase E2 component (dihydrolipoamide acetyltransferase)